MGLWQEMLTGLDYDIGAFHAEWKMSAPISAHPRSCEHRVREGSASGAKSCKGARMQAHLASPDASDAHIYPPSGQ